ncbi:MAG: S9 family peptidase [Bacteroidia bacterium]|nr:S9 family peptidase [Bacteroidia bacterium]NNJ54973.1 S9 family peptidase [Bacteroidia bacterium]
MQAPQAKKIPKELTIHGDTRVDNYYWMNQREDQEVIDHLNAENAYTKEVLKPTENFQSELYEEMVGRIKKDDESVPYRKRGYWYYTRFVTEGEYPIFCRKKGSGSFKDAGEEEVMMDVNEMAKGHSYYKIGGLGVSPNNKLLVYSEDTLSRRIYTLKLKDLETGKFLEMEIPGTTGGATWASDNETIFYTERDETTLRSYKIVSYNIHTKESQERYVEMDDTFNCGVYKSKSEKYIIISSGASITSEYQFIAAEKPKDEFKMFQPRIRGLEYGISHFEDRWYVLTNWDAQNFRLMQTKESNTTRENWTEVIGHRKDTLLEGIELFKNFMVVEERTDGQNHMRIIDQQTNEEYYMEFDSETYNCWSSTNPEFDTEILRYGYTSMTTPSSVFDFNMRTRERKLLKQQEVIGGYNEEEYDSKRVWATARDGERIPMSVVFKKSENTEPRPLLLYAYGSYGHSLDPYFSTIRLSLLDRGFMYVIAHIRGGEDLGRKWYDNGKLLKKKNTFYDFIDCAEHLIKEKYTVKDNLYAIGGSAGGLLMGAIINYRPDLWNGVIAAVPFVDVVTTMLDDTIPLTTGEYDEWGNPNEKEYYHYIKSYSPYDNIEEKEYPNMLITTGLHDSQVQYWEPAKWLAKLRELKTDKNTLIMSCNMDTGHGGASGRFEALKETAKEYAFLFMLEGIEK